MADILNFDRNQSITIQFRLVNAFWKRLPITFQGRKSPPSSKIIFSIFFLDRPLQDVSKNNLQVETEW
jgi:hypothetical protein